MQPDIMIYTFSGRKATDIRNYFEEKSKEGGKIEYIGTNPNTGENVKCYTVNSIPLEIIPSRGDIVQLRFEGAEKKIRSLVSKISEEMNMRFE